jgi:hypothetical protein
MYNNKQPDSADNPTSGTDSGRGRAESIDKIKFDAESLTRHLERMKHMLQDLDRLFSSGLI